MVTNGDVPDLHIFCCYKHHQREAFGIEEWFELPADVRHQWPRGREGILVADEEAFVGLLEAGVFKERPVEGIDIEGVDDLESQVFVFVVERDELVPRFRAASPSPGRRGDEHQQFDLGVLIPLMEVDGLLVRGVKEAEVIDSCFRHGAVWLRGIGGYNLLVPDIFWGGDFQQVRGGHIGHRIIAVITATITGHQCQEHHGKRAEQDITQGSHNMVSIFHGQH